MPFQENIETQSESIEMVGKRLVKQYYRKWIRVTDVHEINVNITNVDGQEIFVSNTSEYLPCWLREPAELSEFPEDAPLDYGPMLEQHV
jgi:hypothetical protein